MSRAAAAATRAAATRAALALVAALASGAGCAVRDPIATGDDVGAACAGAGTPLLADGTCPGDLAAPRFRHAACACGSLAPNAALVTDGFDSRVAPYAPGGQGGDVAGNLELSAAADLTVGGDLTVAGAGGIQGGDRLDVAGDLACGGDLGRPSSAITVGGAARIAGDVDVASLDVAGALTTAPGAAQAGAITAGSTATADVAVPAPCPCDDLDVAALVAAHAASNDDADLGVAADALAAVDGDATLTLPCGRFYLDRIQGTGAGVVTIAATGHAALFVAGNVTLSQDLAIELAPGAELDLFVAGTLQSAGALRLGDPARPAALRIYVAAGGAITLGDGSTLAGNLYAPRADLTTPASLELYGAVVVNHLAGAGPVAIHHDRAVEAADVSCP